MILPLRYTRTFTATPHTRFGLRIDSTVSWILYTVGYPVVTFPHTRCPTIAALVHVYRWLRFIYRAPRLGSALPLPVTRIGSARLRAFCYHTHYVWLVWVTPLHTYAHRYTCGFCYHGLPLRLLPFGYTVTTPVPVPAVPVTCQLHTAYSGLYILPHVPCSSAGYLGYRFTAAHLRFVTFCTTHRFTHYLYYLVYAIYRTGLRVLHHLPFCRLPAVGSFVAVHCPVVGLFTHTTARTRLVTDFTFFGCSPLPFTTLLVLRFTLRLLTVVVACTRLPYLRTYLLFAPHAVTWFTVPSFYVLPRLLPARLVAVTLRLPVHYTVHRFTTCCRACVLVTCRCVYVSRTRTVVTYGSTRLYYLCSYTTLRLPPFPGSAVCLRLVTVTFGLRWFVLPHVLLITGSHGWLRRTVTTPHSTRTFCSVYAHHHARTTYCTLVLRGYGWFNAPRVYTLHAHVYAVPLLHTRAVTVIRVCGSCG